jgi:predicted permease
MKERESIRHRYRRLIGRNVAAELDAELRFHFDMRVEELVARGMDREAARQAVLQRLGPIETARAECETIDHRQQRREVRVEMLETLVQDLRHALRGLSRQKAWTATAILTLALGIGATSALFTIVNAVMIRPLPYPDADRVLSLSQSMNGSDMSVVPDYLYQAWQKRSRSFSAIAAYTGSGTVLQVGDEPEAVTGLAVAQPYFAVMGILPERGRVFLPDEDVQGAARVTVLSDQLWRRAYGADTSIIGRSVLFDGVPHTVVGVMPPQFTTQHRAQYWVPLRMPASEEKGSVFYYQVLGRLAESSGGRSVTMEGALADLTAIAKAANADKGPEAAKVTPLIMTLRDRRLGDTGTTLLILLAAVGVLLLIACVNVANLLLARAASRRRELSVRVALGASWWRLSRYLLCEGLVLSVAGAGIGLVIASASVGYFARIGPTAVSRAEGLGLDWRVVSFTTALALLTGLVFGLLPAWSAMREDVSASIATGSGGRNAGSIRQNRVRRALVVLELGTALVLVTAAGLLSKSFFRVTSTASGVDPSHLLVADVQLARSRYPDGAAGPFYDQLLAAVRATPGVVSASMTQAAPIGGARMSTRLTLPDGSQTAQFWIFAVDDAYFRTAGIPIVAGRGFLPSDVASKASVAVVSESLARALAGKLGGNVIGSTLPTHGEVSPPTIIGIAGDVRQQGLETDPTMQLYLSLAHQGADNYLTLLVRTAGDPAAMVGPVRSIVRRLDKRQPAPVMETMEHQMADQVAPRRFRFILLGLFAVLAATLAAVGLYGVMSYVVTERTNEIGVRVALGADRSRVMRLVVGEGMAMTAVAAVLGLAGSLAAVRALQSMVFRVSVYDPWIFAAGALILGAVAVVACAFPAWRAAKVDPISALRSG